MTEETKELVALKPCPFCGGDGQPMVNGSQGTFLAYIECRTCGCQTRTFIQKETPPASRAITAWNTRLTADRERSAGEDVDKVRQLVAQVEAGKFDAIEAFADQWFESAGVQRMANAMASVFEKHAPQDIMDRFREKLGAMMHLAFVEGAVQGVMQFAENAKNPCDADWRGTLKRVFSRPGVLDAMQRGLSSGGFPMIGDDVVNWSDWLIHRMEIEPAPPLPNPGEALSDHLFGQGESRDG